MSQDTYVDTSFLNFLAAANTFRGALKQLKKDEHILLKKKEIFKELKDIQNIIKLKILCLENANKKKTQEKSLSTFNKESDMQSLKHLHPELSSQDSSPPKHTRSVSVGSESESESLNTSKLTSSMSNVCNTKTSESDYLNENDEEFKNFFVQVSCPFCLKREDNKYSLVKHFDTACICLKDKKFIRSSKCPYSVFQILPNNTFKCNICPNSFQKNLKEYFEHSQSLKHISAYKKAVCIKNYTELIFCASCKVQIPNNATQIQCHLEHKAHEKNTESAPRAIGSQKKRVQCVYGRNKKFKCLNCPPGKATYQTLKEILLHLESGVHDAVKCRSLASVYCSFCLVEVRIFNIMVHLNSNEHALKEKEEIEEQFELCFYCGFKCTNLADLALHVEEECDAINLIRQDNHPNRGDFDRNMKQTEKDQKIQGKEKTNDGGRCIIVKDCPKILELINYFNKFGEVLDVEPSRENAVMITFQEKETVDDIFEKQGLIEIKGVKPKITRKENLENLDSSEKKKEETTNKGDLNNTNTIVEETRKENSWKVESTNSCSVPSGSGFSGFSANVSGSRNSTVSEEFSKVMVNNDTLESVFKRASTHLSSCVLRADCGDCVDIALDCEKILKFGKFHSTGFFKCGLTFPVENITLYCQLKDNLIEKMSLDTDCTSLTEFFLFNENMCRTCIRTFDTSVAASNARVIGKSFPLVQFYHNKTNKLCTITFRESDNILTEALSYCLKEKNDLRCFALVVRFWFSIHRLAIKQFEFVIISLLLFFLRASGAVTSFPRIFRNNRAYSLLTEHVRIQDVGHQFQPFFKGNQNAFSITDLFQQFLLFLNKFDFENAAICLPFNQPVPKTVLLKEPLKDFLCKPHDLDSPVWIFDAFLYNNLAKDVKKADLDELLEVVRETVEHYHIC